MKTYNNPFANSTPANGGLASHFDDGDDEQIDLDIDGGDSGNYQPKGFVMNDVKK